MNSNLPPGTTPGMIDALFEEGPCQVCGRSEDGCICQECPTCGEMGDPLCYEKHGLVRSAEQIESYRETVESEQRRIQAENEYFDRLA